MVKNNDSEGKLADDFNQFYFDILSIERLNVFQKRSNIVIKMII